VNADGRGTRLARIQQHRPCPCRRPNSTGLRSSGVPAGVRHAEPRCDRRGAVLACNSPPPILPRFFPCTELSVRMPGAVRNLLVFRDMRHKVHSDAPCCANLLRTPLQSGQNAVTTFSTWPFDHLNDGLETGSGRVPRFCNVMHVTNNLNPIADTTRDHSAAAFQSLYRGNRESPVDSAGFAARRLWAARHSCGGPGAGEIPFFASSRVSCCFLVAMRRADLILYCGAINLGLDVVLNLVLMRWFGIAGIALATSIWSWSSFLLFGYWMRRVLPAAA